eukprot:GHVT01081516.1.p1 GENE.GHVT01081516.1~~GHVT01081516.1.p1  ORF type:complete len:578 (+),score=133.02 GHVT01081516.1:1097-2830(+)
MNSLDAYDNQPAATSRRLAPSKILAKATAVTSLLQVDSGDRLQQRTPSHSPADASHTREQSASIGKPTAGSDGDTAETTPENSRGQGAPASTREQPAAGDGAGADRDDGPDVLLLFESSSGHAGSRRVKASPCEPAGRFSFALLGPHSTGRAVRLVFTNDGTQSQLPMWGEPNALELTEEGGNQAEHSQSTGERAARPWGLDFTALSLHSRTITLRRRPAAVSDQVAVEEARLEKDSGEKASAQDSPHGGLLKDTHPAQGSPTSLAATNGGALSRNANGPIGPKGTQFHPGGSQGSRAHAPIAGQGEERAGGAEPSDVPSEPPEDRGGEDDDTREHTGEHTEVQTGHRKTGHRKKSARTYETQAENFKRETADAAPAPAASPTDLKTARDDATHRQLGAGGGAVVSSLPNGQRTEMHPAGVKDPKHHADPSDAPEEAAETEEAGGVLRDTQEGNQTHSGGSPPTASNEQRRPSSTQRRRGEEDNDGTENEKDHSSSESTLGDTSDDARDAPDRPDAPATGNRSAVLLKPGLAGAAPTATSAPINLGAPDGALGDWSSIFKDWKFKVINEHLGISLVR